MKLKIIKAGPWGNIYGKRRTFKMDEVIEVGVDVSDDIAETMLRCDYVEKAGGIPKIETKKEPPAKPEPSGIRVIKECEAKTKEEKKSSKRKNRAKKGRS